MKIYLLFIICLLPFFSCNENKSIISPTNSYFRLEKFYGLEISNKANLYWEIGALTEATQLALYRHMLPGFSYERSDRLATIQVTDSMKIFGVNTRFIDSTVVSGSIYYYTIVPEKVQGINNVIKSLTSSTIPIPVYDYASIPTSEIKYSKHIQPIFSGGCAIHGCHAGDEHNTLQKLLHGGSELSLRSWNDALNGTVEVAQIVPFRASKSHIIHHLNADTLISPIASPSMPPAFTFPTELRDVIIRWINDGAKNDDGTVAYSTIPVRGWGYVTNQGEDLTAVIDLDKNKIARYIMTGVENANNAQPQSPHNVIVDWQNQYYYVNLIGGSKLLKFRLSDNVKVGELTSGLSSPAQVALTKNSDTAYVSNFENAKTNITIVNTTTMTKLADIGSPAQLKPHGVTITPDFKYVLVANSLSDNVTVIRTSDNVIVKTIPLSGSVPDLPIAYTFQYEPYQSVVTPDNNFAFVTCRKSGEVRVIDMQQLQVVDSIKVGTIPLIPAISPDGQWVYVANRNSKSVSVIKTSTRTVEYTIADVGVEPHGVAVSKDGKFVYVSCENLGISDPPHHPTVGGKKVGFLKIIDAATRTVVGSIEVGNFGAGVAVMN